MEEVTMRFNEMQLKLSGFGDAITPELKKKMEEGGPIIQHPFKKDYDGANVEATLYLKKSASSDLYFLNKFDVQLHKEGQAEALKQTFYINKPKVVPGEEKATQQDQQQKIVTENRYTLKEAYNLLDGRPVHKHLLNKEGQEYEAWVKINFKNTFESGNHELKQYHKNYGYDLEKTLAQYPIQELRTQQYKDALIESLNRGNLQKVTFKDKDGQEEKLFISPNITQGSLNVYDGNKQLLQVEQLIEKQQINREFAQGLVDRQKKQLKRDDDTEQHQKQQQSQKLNNGSTGLISAIVDPNNQYNAEKRLEQEKLNGPKINHAVIHFVEPGGQQKIKDDNGKGRQNF